MFREEKKHLPFALLTPCQILTLKKMKAKKRPKNDPTADGTSEKWRRSNFKENLFI